MNPESLTETYAAIRLDIGTRRWAGVPFYLRAGKRLGRRVTEIAVVFKRAPQYLFAESQTSALGQNALVIRVQPDEGVTIRFGSKVPGAGMQVRDVTMDFGYGHAFTEASPEAYERLHPRRAARRPAAVPAARGGRAVAGRSSTRSRSTGRPRARRAVRTRELGPGIRRRPDGPRRPSLEAAMIVDLPNTTTSQISKALVKIREEGGAVALGRVLTLIIATKLGEEEEAIEAANDASREHPMRVIVLSTDDAGRRRSTSRLDAQIRVGGDAGASEVDRRCARTATRPRDQESLVTGLLLPDAPVVAWWPGSRPRRRLDVRHRQDRASGGSPMPPTSPTRSGRSRGLSHTYAPGDTDFAWTRLTLWRAQLAAVLDQPPYEPVTAIEVHGAATRPRRCCSPHGCSCS